jgi:hypothetical protein
METKKTITSANSCDANRDPLSGAPGAHPVGVGTGAAGGGIAGAVIGAAVGGPIGAAVGAVAGTVAGGLAGKGAAEAINPTAEHAYWRAEYAKRPYFTPGLAYEQYGPAYQYGWESRASNKGKAFKDVETQLARDWESRRGESTLNWNHVKDATHDAWLRVDDSTTLSGSRPA